MTYTRKNSIQLLFTITKIICALQLLFEAGTEDIERLVVEENIKMAIFGSFYYDPLYDVFNIPPSEHHPSHFNGSQGMSTAIGMDGEMSKHFTSTGAPSTAPHHHGH